MGVPSKIGRLYYRGELTGIRYIAKKIVATSGP